MRCTVSALREAIPFVLMPTIVPTQASKCVSGPLKSQKVSSIRCSSLLCGLGFGKETRELLTANFSVADNGHGGSMLSRLLSF